MNFAARACRDALGRDVFFEIVAAAPFPFLPNAPMLLRMIPLPLLAFGMIACILGIIALLPDFDGFSDEHLTDERFGGRE